MRETRGRGRREWDTSGHGLSALGEKMEMKSTKKRKIKNRRKDMRSGSSERVCVREGKKYGTVLVKSHLCHVRGGSFAGSLPHRDYTPPLTSGGVHCSGKMADATECPSSCHVTSPGRSVRLSATLSEQCTLREPHGVRASGFSPH